jgi:hypothetical protein
VKQTADGKFSDHVLSQAVATLALCESYAMTADPMLKGPAQRAANALISKQKDDGSWDGIPKAAGPGAGTGAWQIMALKSAQTAGLSVPVATWKQVLKSLDAQQDAKDPPSAALAAYFLCRLYLGWGPRNPQMNKGIEQLAKKLPDAKLKDIEYYYFATPLLRFVDGDRDTEPWKSWEPKIRDLLIDSQDQGQDPKHIEHKGSWSLAGDALAPFGGRLMQTSLALSILEAKYRHFPLYRRELGDKRQP